MDTAASGALPNLVVIGAMKCGTTALHRTLDGHPDVAMSAPKELNFFCGARHSPLAPTEVSVEPTDGRIWARGNWHRGLSWYARHFTAEAPVRGESSPGYTSPSHPEVVTRMAALIPGVRLIYLVRDPVARALSQYRHHQREGTETRSVEEAILDPASQYLSRGRYYQRLEPFLAHFPARRLPSWPKNSWCMNVKRCAMSSSGCGWMPGSGTQLALSGALRPTRRQECRLAFAGGWQICFATTPTVCASGLDVTSRSGRVTDRSEQLTDGRARTRKRRRRLFGREYSA